MSTVKKVASSYEAFEIRVMWKRRAARMPRWVQSLFFPTTPIYVFVARLSNSEETLRIGLIAGEQPFLIKKYQEHDGGRYRHGPIFRAVAYDDPAEERSLLELFELLRTWAQDDTHRLSEAEETIVSTFNDWIEDELEKRRARHD